MNGLNTAFLVAEQMDRVHTDAAHDRMERRIRRTRRAAKRQAAADRR